LPTLWFGVACHKTVPESVDPFTIDEVTAKPVEGAAAFATVIVAEVWAVAPLVAVATTFSA
jgi:hypothetical protein